VASRGQGKVRRLQWRQMFTLGWLRGRKHELSPPSGTVALPSGLESLFFGTTGEPGTEIGAGGSYPARCFLPSKKMGGSQANDAGWPQFYGKYVKYPRSKKEWWAYRVTYHGQARCKAWWGPLRTSRNCALECVLWQAREIHCGAMEPTELYQPVDWLGI
jgi:hypothetical protein